MNGSNQIVRETLATLKAAGFEPHVIKARHIKICWTDPGGRRRLLVVSNSPSCRNAIHRARATLRRLMATYNSHRKP